MTERRGQPVHGEFLSATKIKGLLELDTIAEMREFLLLLAHLVVVVVRLAKPGGLCGVVAESALVRHQLLIMNRGRKRAPNLRVADRFIAGVCTCFICRTASLLRHRA